MSFGFDGAHFYGVQITDQKKSFSLDLDQMKLNLTKNRHKIFCQLNEAALSLNEDRLDSDNAAPLKILQYFEFSLKEARVALNKDTEPLIFSMRADQELVRIDSKSDGDESFEGSIYLKGEKQSSFSCKNVALKKLWPYIKRGLPLSQTLLLKEGQLDTQILARVLENGFQVEEASTTIRNLNVYETAKELAFKSKALRCDFQKQGTDFTLKSDLTGAKLSFISQFHEARLSFKELNGKLHYDTKQARLFEISGKMHCRDQVQSIFVTGEPKFSQDDLSCSLDLSIENGNTPSALSVHFGVKDRDHGFVLLHFQDMQARNFLSVKRFIDERFKEIQTVECKSGLVSGALNLEFYKGQLLNLQLQQVSAKDLEVFDPTKNASLSCPLLTLDLFYEPQKTGIKKIKDLRLVAKKADVLCTIDGQRRKFNKTDGQFCIKNGLFESSFVKCMYEGVSSQIVFLGDYNNLEMEGYFRAKLTKLLALADLVPIVSDDCDARLSFHANFKNKAFDVSANLVLDDIEEKRVDVKAQGLDFKGFNLDSFKRFSISAKSAPKPFLDTVLVKFAPKLQLQGDFLFNLDYQDQKFSLCMEGNEIKAKRANFIVYSHTNVSGDKAVKAWAKFSKDLSLTDANLVVDNIFIKDLESQLEARQIKAHALFSQGAFHIDRAKFDMCGINFQANGSLFKEGNSYVAKLSTTEAIGSVSQVNTLFTHIKPLSSIQLPFDGQVIGKNRGVEFDIAYQDTFSFSYKIDLLCKHASMPVSKKHSLEEISFGFSYDSNQNLMQVSDVSANLKHEKQTIPITLQGKGSWYLDQDIHASVVAFMDENEILDSHFSYNPKKKNFALKKNSHFMNVMMDQCNFENEKIDVHAEISNYELASFLELAHQLNFLSESSYLRGSKGLLASKIQAEFCIQGKKEQCQASLRAKDCLIGGKSIQDLEVVFVKQGQEIELKHATMDEHQIEAKFELKERGIAICNLDYKDKRTSLKIDRGFYDYGQKSLTFMHQLHVSGNDLTVSDIDIKGSSILDLQKEIKSLQLESQIELSSKEHGIDFKSQTPISWSINPDLCCLVDAFNGAIHVKNVKADLQVSEGKFSLFNDIDSYLKASLTYKPGIQKLVHLFKVYKHDFMDLEPIEAVDFNLVFSDNKMSGSLCLDSYYYKNALTPVEFTECQFLFHEGFQSFSANAKFLDEQVLVQAEIQNKKSFFVKLLKDDKECAFLDGYISQKHGPMITHCHADLFGVGLKISEQNLNDPQIKRLCVEAEIDFDSLKRVLSPNFREFVKNFELNKGISLCAEVVLFNKDFKRSYLEGQIKGKNCDILGYKIDSLYSTLFVDRKNVILQNLCCADTGVCVQVPEIMITKDKKGTSLRIAEVCVKDLRPSVLTKEGRKSSKIDPFMVRHFLVKDIQGSLEDINTLRGKGHLVFENHALREHSIAKLPLEFISSLGLDRVLLVPVQGEMDCDLKGIHLFFSNLKDSYSQGRRSVFMLSQKAPSYIDLKGNIHMNIKMKQNVLFKFTELFVLSIRGRLDEPVFSLQ